MSAAISTQTAPSSGDRALGDVKKRDVRLANIVAARGKRDNNSFERRGGI